MLTKLIFLFSEPIASKSVVKQIQFYKEKWMSEQEHYQVVSRDVTELKVDVKQLKEEVKEVSEKIIPQTQEEVETMKQGKLHHILSVSVQSPSLSFFNEGRDVHNMVGNYKAQMPAKIAYV